MHLCHVFTKKPNIHPMKKPALAFLVLLYCIHLRAQNLNICPTRTQHLTSELLAAILLYKHNLHSSASTTTRWTGFSQHPLAIHLSGNFLPPSALSGLLFGGELAMESYGPFRNYSFLPSVSVLKTDRNFASGYYAGLKAGFAAGRLISSGLVWRENEPIQYETDGIIKALIAYEAGGWISFDRKRKILMVDFNSHNITDTESKRNVFSRLVSGRYQVKWINGNEESHTETTYELWLTDLKYITHTASFRYYSPIGLFGGIQLDSNFESACLAGYRWLPTYSEDAFFDFAYTFGYSLARYGPFAGNSHGLSIRYSASL